MIGAETGQMNETDHMQITIVRSVDSVKLLVLLRPGVCDPGHTTGCWLELWV